MINPTRLQQAREIRGFTQTALAQQVGVHQSAIAQLETGRIATEPRGLGRHQPGHGLPAGVLHAPQRARLPARLPALSRPRRDDRPSAPAGLVVCAHAL